MDNIGIVWSLLKWRIRSVTVNARSALYVMAYLAAIIIANMAVTFWGPAVLPYTAFFLIGLDLTARDKLHEIWHEDGFLWKMGLLIAAGSVLSWLLNRDAGPVALASFAAFASAAAADTVVYEFMYKSPRLWKMNGSNVVSSLVDSVVFPTVAFGVFMPEVIIVQFLVKMFGGFFWSLVLNRRYVAEQVLGKK